MIIQISCPVCGAYCELLDVVDFNKSCLENNGVFLKLSGVPVYYAICTGCKFCFAPELCCWDREAYIREIYNEGYRIVDPEYLYERPAANAQMLNNIFGSYLSEVRHLDYGGGNGLLSKKLKGYGWNSLSYDPMETEMQIAENLSFDLITAFEVFEHVPDPKEIMNELSKLLSKNGIIFFTTEASDGNIVVGKRLDWWYAAPRNGHVSLYSYESLSILGKKNNLMLHNFSNSYHAYYRSVPSWAGHLFGL